MRAAQEGGCLEVLLESEVMHIDPTTVVLQQRGTTRSIPNDVVIVCAGGVLPTQFLKDIGVEVETKYGTA